MEDKGEVVIFFSLVFTYENAERDIFITDEIVLTDRFKKSLLEGMEYKIDLFLDRIRPYLN